MASCDMSDTDVGVSAYANMKRPGAPMGVKTAEHVIRNMAYDMMQINTAEFFTQMAKKYFSRMFHKTICNVVTMATGRLRIVQ